MSPHQCPSLTKNRTKEWNSEMYQTKNGNQWYFDMKDYIGVGLIRLIHSAAATADNVPDSQMPPDLLHGKKLQV